MTAILARKTLLIIMNNVVGGVFGFITLALIARHLEVDDLGMLGFALSFLGMFTFIANLGFDLAHNKRTSEGQDFGQCLGTFIYIKVVLVSVMAAVSLAAIGIYVYFFGGFDSTKELTVVLVILLYYVVWFLASIPLITFNAERKQAKAQISNSMEFLVRGPLIIGLVLAGFGIVYVALSYVAGALVLFGLGVFFLRGCPVKKPSRESLKSYIAFATPMSMVSVIYTLYLYLDKVMLGVFWNNQEVGFYYGAQRIIMFLITSSAAIAILLFPTISSLHAKGDLKTIGDLITRAERYLSMLIFPVIALTIALNASIVQVILGGGFDESGVILVFLALFALLSILNRPYSQVIMGTGKTTIAVKISISIFAVNFFLNLVFIPEEMAGLALLGLGGVGAAIATFLADTGRFVLLRVEAKRLIGKTFQPLPMVKHLVSSALAAVVIFWVHGFVPENLENPLLMLELLGGLIIYFLILVLVREFKKEDLHFFLDIVHPKKMGGYILSEIKEKGKEEQ